MSSDDNRDNGLPPRFGADAGRPFLALMGQIVRVIPFALERKQPVPAGLSPGQMSAMQQHLDEMTREAMSVASFCEGFATALYCADLITVAQFNEAARMMTLAASNPEAFVAPQEKQDGPVAPKAVPPDAEPGAGPG